MIRIENMRENTEGDVIGSEKKKKSEKKEIKKLRYKKSPSGDLTFDGVQNTYLISPVLGSYASP